MRSLPRVIKDYVIQTTHLRVNEWWREQPEDERGPIGSYCLWWAYHLTCVLRGMDIPAQIQAGTAYWPRLRQDQDDGLPTTLPHFGYQYTPSTGDLVRIAVFHRLPEMHVWVGIPGADGFPPTIIDPTTQWWPDLCRLRIGKDWPGDKPPLYFWGSKAPPGVVYEPHREAIRLCYIILSLTQTIGA
jgi:hypothetical protein